MNIDNIVNTVRIKLEEWINIVIQMLPNIAVAVIIVILFYITAKLIKKFTRNVLRRFSDHIAVNRLIAQIMFLIVISIGFFISLGILNLDKAVTTLLAGAGIIGLALGFAFQDIAANFISGIILSIRQPFGINDIIKSNDYFGTVKKINLRTTDILTLRVKWFLYLIKTSFKTHL